MASREEIYQAIRNADAAGDADSVRKLGAYLQTMDGPAPTPAPPTERGLGAELARQGGLTVRAGVKGVLALPGMVSDAATGLYNTAADAVAGKGNGYRFKTVQSSLDDLLNRAGLPQPENAVERVAGEGAAAMAGGAAQARAAQAASNGLTGVAREVADRLAAGPGVQVVSGGTGAVAGGTARENGAGFAGQLGASVLGGMAPSLGLYAGSEGLRRLLRGGDENIPNLLGNINTFKEAGTTPTVGQVTEGRLPRAIESLLAKTPGGAGIMVKKAEEQANDVSGRVNALVSDITPKASAEASGRAIKEGVQGQGGFVDRMKGTQADLYKKLDAQIPGQSKVSVDNTRDALNRLTAVIDGAPNIGNRFVNGRISGILDDFNLDTGLVRPSGSYTVTTPFGPQQAAPQAGVQTVTQPSLIRQVAGRRNGEGLPSPPTTRTEPAVTRTTSTAPIQGGEGVARRAPYEPSGSVTREISVAPVVAGEGGWRPPAVPTLPYEAVKKLRTQVGEEMASNALVADVPRSQWKQLYAGMSEDLGNAAQANGPAAEQAWKRANQYTSAAMKRLETIGPIVDKADPESIFSAATSGTREGATRFRAVLQSLQPEERNTVLGTLIKRLGVATPGKQNDLGDTFSTETFLTNWNRLSPEAKSAVFGRLPEDAQKAIKSVASVASNVREGSKVFANPSGTAPALSLQHTGLGVLGAALTGNPLTAVGLASVPVGANLLARKMVDPKFVNWLAQDTELSPALTPAQINLLATLQQGR